MGGYERGERDISLSRFCELARLYGIPPGRLLTDALAPEVTATSGALAPEVVIDLARLAQLEGEEGLSVAQFVHELKALRGDYMTDVITLRAGDVEILASTSGKEPRQFLAKLRPALRQPPAERADRPATDP